MIVIESEQLIPCDVDFTLLLWGPIKRGDKVVTFTDPYTGEQKPVKVHQPNLKILTTRLARGATIQVWSASGWQWARAALKALKIEHKNIIISSKPIAHLDDRPCQEWMGERVFLPEDSNWK